MATNNPYVYPLPDDTNNIRERMDNQIAQFIKTCQILEKNNDGLTRYFMNTPEYKRARDLETKVESEYNNGNIVALVGYMTQLRIEWLKAADRFKKRGVS